MTSAFTADRSNIATAIGIAVVAGYFAFLSWAVGTWPYDRYMVVVLTPLLIVIGVLIIVGVTRDDPLPLTRLVVIAFLLKLAASLVRYFVAFSIYGTGDAERYDIAGAEIANSYHRGETTITELLAVGRGTAFLDDFTGIVYAVMGPSDLGGFVLFSWIGFWGLLFFVRALMIGIPEADHRRYAILVLYLPSLLFWPSSIGKEAIMLFALGLCAYGSARVLARMRWGWSALAVGGAVGYLVRPHVVAVVLGALAIALVFRDRPGHEPIFGPLGRIITVGVIVLGTAFVLSRAVDQLLPTSEAETTTEAVGELLERAEAGTDQGGSAIDQPRPNSPVEYPTAVFTVLFRPTIFEARTGATLFASLETTLVLMLFVVGRKRLRQIPSLLFSRPYLLLSIVYTAVFGFAWSAFANLGALARQRVQVWPFVLVLIALPLVAPAAKSKLNRSQARPTRIDR